MTDDAHVCYILHNCTSRTYNGYTNNPARRIRQHNGILKGGAKFTRGKPTWSYLAWVKSAQFTKHTALSFEWSVKYPTGHRPRPREYNGAIGRLKGLALALKNPKFEQLNFDVSVVNTHFELLKELCSDAPHVTVTSHEF